MRFGVRAPHFLKPPGSAAHSNGPVLDDEILSDREVSAVIESNGGSVVKEMSIQNVDRSVGGRIAGAIASKHGDDGFKGEIKLSFVGSAGQSFGVWNTSGVHLRVEGDCNDYVEKASMEVPSWPSSRRIAPSRQSRMSLQVTPVSTAPRAVRYS